MRIRAIVVYLFIAFGLSWLVALPLWLGDGLKSPLMPVIAVAMMATPTIAALTVVFFVERSARTAEALGLRPIGAPKRFVGFLALGLVVPIALVVIALLVGSLLGVYRPDLQNFSGFRELVMAQLASAGVDSLPTPIIVLVLAQCAAVFVGAIINTFPALGEEIGWRGFLLPRLMPLGPVGAILVSGVIWGLWHAPLILLGYNYPDVEPWLGLATMVGLCTVIGAVFGWLRLRSGSVWPAALAHGSFNAAFGLSLVFSSAEHPFNTAEATILGWTGWIVPVILIAAFVATGRFKARNPAVSRGVSSEAA